MLRAVRVGRERVPRELALGQIARGDAHGVAGGNAVFVTEFLGRENVDASFGGREGLLLGREAKIAVAHLELLVDRLEARIL